MFADDTIAFLEHSSLAELEILANSELQKLVEWFKANKLSLNVSKTCYMSFTSSKKKGSSSGLRLFIGQDAIDQVENTKLFLEVYLDEKLTWSSHMKITANKIAKT